MKDVTVYDGGSVQMVTPETPEAREWIDRYLDLEGWQWMGNAFAVEPRYLPDLLGQMVGDGLDVELPE